MNSNMSIAEHLQQIKGTIPEHVTLVAVSKTKPVATIMEAYEAGQRVFGENKVQEMTQKWEIMPKDIQWHMIGHLQRNKVKYMASFVSLIHGVDSLKLLKEIDKQARKHDRVIDCLLQIHIAEESTKFGMDEAEVTTLLSSEEFKGLKNIRVTGLMGMATFTQDQQQIQKEFEHLSELFKKLERNYTETFNFKLETLSMGMSGDYKLAIAQGSTMVRIGSSIFGARNYH